jgi:hypothetical protein
MELFLDTNVYLSFYKLSDDDLEELQKLAVAVRSEGTTPVRHRVNEGFGFGAGRESVLGVGSAR